MNWNETTEEYILRIRRMLNSVNCNCTYCKIPTIILPNTEVYRKLLIELNDPNIKLKE